MEENKIKYQCKKYTQIVSMHTYVNCHAIPVYQYSTLYRQERGNDLSSHRKIRIDLILGWTVVVYSLCHRALYRGFRKEKLKNN